jgi:hypothetical protein
MRISTTVRRKRLFYRLSSGCVQVFNGASGDPVKVISRNAAHAAVDPCRCCDRGRCAREFEMKSNLRTRATGEAEGR